MSAALVVELHARRPHRLLAVLCVGASLHASAADGGVKVSNLHLWRAVDVLVRAQLVSLKHTVDALQLVVLHTFKRSAAVKRAAAAKGNDRDKGAFEDGALLLSRSSLPKDVLKVGPVPCLHFRSCPFVVLLVLVAAVAVLVLCWVLLPCAA